MAQLVEGPLSDREIMGSIPGRVIPNLKMVLAALSLGTRHEESRAGTGSGRRQYNVTGWNIVSSCLGVIFH